MVGKTSRGASKMTASMEMGPMNGVMVQSTLVSMSWMKEQVTNGFTKQYGGSFLLEIFLGYGKMVWPDGAQYGGMWNNGLLVETMDMEEVSKIFVSC
jgi:hypothetical protein